MASDTATENNHTVIIGGAFSAHDAAVLVSNLAMAMRDGDGVQLVVRAGDGMYEGEMSIRVLNSYGKGNFGVTGDLLALTVHNHIENN